MSDVGYSFYTCRNCGEVFTGVDVEDAAELHDTEGLHSDDHEFEVIAQIEDDVTDPNGKVGTVNQIGEDGEVALVRYADGSEGEWDLVDLLVREDDENEAY